MAAPNMNGRLHLADVHQNSPASLEEVKIRCERKPTSFNNTPTKISQNAFAYSSILEHFKH